MLLAAAYYYSELLAAFFLLSFLLPQLGVMWREERLLEVGLALLLVNAHRARREPAQTLVQTASHPSAHAAIAIQAEAAGPTQVKGGRPAHRVELLTGVVHGLLLRVL